MPTPMPRMKFKLLPDLRFPPEEERAFQKDYFARIHSRLRSHICFLTVLGCLPALLECMTEAKVLDYNGLLAIVGVATISLSLFWLSIHRQLEAVWQLGLVTVVLSALSAAVLTRNSYDLAIILPCLILIIFRLQPLQFRWTVIQVFGTALTFLTAFLMSQNKGWWVANILSAAIYTAVLSAPLFYSYKSEVIERAQYQRKAQLTRERDAERQKREQTERMLHVLSQAIGGIVHDLGNPLTAVQGGAETLLEFAREDEPDEELIQEFAEMISDGAQMLNYLRLSLMEQTRVLEGKPIPVEQKPTSVRHIVEAGTHYQKPKFAAGRHIVLQGDEMEVCVDEMRFITVLMNLIGNALKYSDGQVRVTWQARDNNVFIAVMDQGKKGQGITQLQAEKLFVAFGRLDTHAQIEGTGLGLLSVRKIAEAHQGEVYIEGHADGSATTPLFSTAQGSYASMLETGFLTAFVTACPLKVISQNEFIEQTHTTGMEQKSLR